MTNDSTAVDFGINLLEEEIDDVIFRTNEFLTDATFTGGQGPFWWLPLPIFQNTTLIVVNQLFINSCLVTKNQRGTKTAVHFQHSHKPAQWHPVRCLHHFCRDW